MKTFFLGLALTTFCATASAQVAVPDTSDKSIVFTKVEVEAEFNGGFGAWRNYLVKNLKSDVPVKNGAPLGQYQVIVRFIVSKTGDISEVVAETLHGYGMEQEVIRIIKKGPSWTPAVQNGRPVNAYRRQPVTFVVQEDGIDIRSKEGFKLVARQKNIITVDIAKTDNEDLELTFGGAPIKFLGGNRYEITPTTEGKGLLEVYNLKKKRKRITNAIFEVVSGT